MNKTMTPEKSRLSFRFVMIFCFIGIVVFIVSFGKIMGAVGQWLVFDEKPVRSDAVVVLNTGMGWYPRAMEAATLYRQGLVDKVVINGNRKTDTMRQIEDMGFEKCCPWYEDRVRILGVLGVPREAIMPISAEDAYDTISEAKAVGKILMDTGFASIIVTTSKYHTRRSHYIWENAFPDTFRIHMVAAKSDPFSPQEWWKEGRQIRWVMAEYGAWVFCFWKRLGKVQ